MTSLDDIRRQLVFPRRSVSSFKLVVIFLSWLRSVEGSLLLECILPILHPLSALLISLRFHLKIITGAGIATAVSKVRSSVVFVFSDEGLFYGRWPGNTSRALRCSP